ncbi:hypothetical protein C8A03DRAFT_31250 [Achaetomium macrosporum]|uniref:F-box domain-containing protein n=1 Tax=Achaetomium macrosporum TaxID=79813 RepID=A0AAN7CGW3_9PEZI|nr:hypothetical protein C8A03DRAFT_31250 [Achaetomium macrosporum]
MSFLPPELLLLIVEKLDVPDIVALMFTCRANYGLIKAYEQSIVKARFCRLESSHAFFSYSWDMWDPWFPPGLRLHSFEFLEMLEGGTRGRRAAGDLRLALGCASYVNKLCSKELGNQPKWKGRGNKVEPTETIQPGSQSQSKRP